MTFAGTFTAYDGGENGGEEDSEDYGISVNIG